MSLNRYKMNPHTPPSKLKDDLLLKQIKESENSIQEMTSDLVQNSEHLDDFSLKARIKDLKACKNRFLDLVSEGVDRSLVTVEIKRGKQKILYRL